MFDPQPCFPGGDDRSTLLPRRRRTPKRDRHVLVSSLHQGIRRLVCIPLGNENRHLRKQGRHWQKRYGGRYEKTRNKRWSIGSDVLLAGLGPKRQPNYPPSRGGPGRTAG